MLIAIVEKLWILIFVLSDSGFEGCPKVFNVVEIRRVRRKKENVCAFRLNGLPCLGGFMKGPIIQDHPIFPFKNRDQTTFNPCIKDGCIGMSPESKGSFCFLLTIRRNHCGSGVSYFP